MKMRGSLLVASVLGGLMLIGSSCNRSEIKKLKSENASLQNEICKSDSLQILFMNSYAEIENNLREIKERENMISENSSDAEVSNDMQARIINDIVEIGKLMDNNRKKLQNMESLRRQLIASRQENNKLKKENKELKQKDLFTPNTVFDSVAYAEDADKIEMLSQENARLAKLNASLEQTISQLKMQLAESEARIESLQEELSLLKEAYAALQQINDSLQASNREYLAYIDQKDAEISRLEALANETQPVYYVVANSKTLKAKRIIVKKEVNPNVNFNNFTTVKDRKELRVIETKSSKAEVLSSHPSRSYAINDKDKKNVKIEIKNPDAFWSSSNVCVIQIK